ncbi:hypothetical protein YC2023_079567 [Brassica napus]
MARRFTYAEKGKATEDIVKASNHVHLSPFFITNVSKHLQKLHSTLHHLIKTHACLMQLARRRPS